MNYLDFPILIGCDECGEPYIEWEVEFIGCFDCKVANNPIFHERPFTQIPQCGMPKCDNVAVAWMPSNIFYKSHFSRDVAPCYYCESCIKTFSDYTQDGFRYFAADEWEVV